MLERTSLARIIPRKKNVSSNLLFNCQWKILDIITNRSRKACFIDENCWYLSIFAGWEKTIVVTQQHFVIKDNKHFVENLLRDATWCWRIFGKTRSDSCQAPFTLLKFLLVFWASFLVSENLKTSFGDEDFLMVSHFVLSLDQNTRTQ